MDSEDRKKLERALALSEENNQILKKLLRNMRWGRLVRVAYWTIIIAASVGLFYYLQPYAEQLIKAYHSLSNTVNEVNNFLPK